jgi:hypothetical protein
MADKKGQKKRLWSDEEKVPICEQTCAWAFWSRKLPALCN